MIPAGKDASSSRPRVAADGWASAGLSGTMFVLTIARFLPSFPVAQKGAPLTGHSPDTHPVVSSDSVTLTLACSICPIPQFCPLYCKHTQASPEGRLPRPQNPPRCPNLPTLTQPLNPSTHITICPVARPESPEVVLDFSVPCPSPVVASLAGSRSGYLPHGPTSRPLIACLGRLGSIQTGPHFLSL